MGKALIVVALVVAAGAAWWAMTPEEPPRLEVDRQAIDFGDVPFGHWVTATFTLRNTGRGPLRIADAPKVRALEGC
jgi:hypothetical protein